MILTGSEIYKEVMKGNIYLEPFSRDQLNPNTYNYRLGETLKKFTYFDGEKSIFSTIKIPNNGYLLSSGQMYLGQTMEIIGSKKYTTSLIGKSSLGRLGLLLQLSANLGHTGIKHQWTLELYAALPIIIYPKMIIGQVSFWTNYGDVSPYSGEYGKFSIPQESILFNHNAL